MSEEKNISPEETPQEQPVNNASTDEIVSSAEPIGEVEEPQTPNYKPETDNMEVHHHTHASHGKKTWKDYFWEFLMLFLAVFCGFLAEYQLEHLIEKERGKQYIHSLYEDLKTDTIQCGFQIAELTEKESLLKDMDACFDSITHGIRSPDCLKTIVENAGGFSDFIYTDRTIQQLKFAGGLRLIQDKEIVDSIIGYDAMVREMLIHQEVLENQQQIAVNAHNSMIGYGYVKLSKTTPNSKITLLSTDTKEINRYFNEITSFRKGCFRQLYWIEKIKAKATRLLIFLGTKGMH